LIAGWYSMVGFADTNGIYGKLTVEKNMSLSYRSTVVEWLQAEKINDLCRKIKNNLIQLYFLIALSELIIA